MIAVSKTSLPMMPRTIFISVQCHSASVFSIHKLLNADLLEATALATSAKRTAASAICPPSSPMDQFSVIA